jgi:hypothetical protein
MNTLSAGATWATQSWLSRRLKWLKRNDSFVEQLQDEFKSGWTGA